MFLSTRPGKAFVRAVIHVINKPWNAIHVQQGWSQRKDLLSLQSHKTGEIMRGSANKKLLNRCTHLVVKRKCFGCISITSVERGSERRPLLENKRMCCNSRVRTPPSWSGIAIQRRGVKWRRSSALSVSVCMQCFVASFAGDSWRVEEYLH